MSTGRLSRRVRSALLTAVLVTASCWSPEKMLLIPEDAVPQEEDWTDYGPILESGALGEWDYQLYGGFAAYALRLRGETHFYYQGARGFRIADGTVTGRSIGLATSPNGIEFTKFEANPVLAWSPNSDGEEGAVSAAALVDSTHRVIVYYGANTAYTPTLVHASGRLAYSPDGIRFEDAGVVISRDDPDVWGGGDEIFPVAALEDDGRWIVYYIPNGTSQSGLLGVAWGDRPDRLTNTAGVRSGGRPVRAWGPAGVGRIAPGVYALFLTQYRRQVIEVRALHRDAPDRLTGPLATYRWFPDLRSATVSLDSARRTWFLYYSDREAERYGVKVAPAGEPDTTPPTPPTAPTATPVDHGRVDLSWEPGRDAETGVAAYRLLRDGKPIGTVTRRTFSDTGLVAETDYRYRIAAVNYHGAAGPPGPEILVRTPPDRSPPRLLGVSAPGGERTTVVLTFDEPLDDATAARTSHYSIDGGIRVLRASPGSDGRAVVLVTSPHESGRTYELTVRGLRDRTPSGNPIPSAVSRRYRYSGAAGLLGAWSFDLQPDSVAFDTGGFGNHARPARSSPDGPTPVEGRFGTALRFDGLDDHLTILPGPRLARATGSSHALSAWVRPAGLPASVTPNDSSYSILTRRRAGFHYDHEGRIRGSVLLAGDERVVVASRPLPPDRWHHVALVADEARGILRLYVNGREVEGSPVALTAELAELGKAPFYIGTSDPLPERYENRFRGEIDEVRVYGEALEAEAVASLVSEVPAADPWPTDPP